MEEVVHGLQAAAPSAATYEEDDEIGLQHLARSIDRAQRQI